MMKRDSKLYLGQPTGVNGAEIDKAVHGWLRFWIQLLSLGWSSQDPGVAAVQTEANLSILEKALDSKVRGLEIKTHDPLLWEHETVLHKFPLRREVTVYPINKQHRQRALHCDLIKIKKKKKTNNPL
jgi:hypothetical protein